MTQHVYRTSYRGAEAEILMGFDRPLQGYFLVIEVAGMRDYLYSNLRDARLSPFMGMSPDLDYFRGKLAEFGLTVPDAMFEQIKRDQLLNVGTRRVVYRDDGSFQEQR